MTTPATIYVARSEAEAIAAARARLGRAPASFRRDEDVLDTWFSSALWCHLDARLAGRHDGAADVSAVVGARSPASTSSSSGSRG